MSLFGGKSKPSETPEAQVSATALTLVSEQVSTLESKLSELHIAADRIAKEHRTEIIALNSEHAIKIREIQSEYEMKEKERKLLEKFAKDQALEEAKTEICGLKEKLSVAQSERDLYSRTLDEERRNHRLLVELLMKHIHQVEFASELGMSAKSGSE